MEGYIKSQIQKVVAAQGCSEYSMRIQIRAGDGVAKTNWLNVRTEDVKRLASILKDT